MKPPAALSTSISQPHPSPNSLFPSIAFQFLHDLNHNRVQETLPKEVLAKMYAPGQDTSIPFIDAATLASYDAFLLGIPTRYGNFPAQWKVFWDTTGKLWQTGGLWGKYCGLFISTASMGGGQESTALATMSTLAHQYVCSPAQPTTQPLHRTN